MKVYLAHYCNKCKKGMKMVLIDGIIRCPECDTIIYNKVKS